VDNNGANFNIITIDVNQFDINYIDINQFFYYDVNDTNIWTSGLLNDQNVWQGFLHVDGNITSDDNITAQYFYGNGANLTGLPSATGAADGNVYSLGILNDKNGWMIDVNMGLKSITSSGTSFPIIKNVDANNQSVSAGNFILKGLLLVDKEKDPSISESGGRLVYGTPKDDTTGKHQFYFNTESGSAALGFEMSRYIFDVKGNSIQRVQYIQFENSIGSGTDISEIRYRTAKGNYYNTTKDLNHWFTEGSTNNIQCSIGNHGLWCPGNTKLDGGELCIKGVCITQWADVNTYSNGSGDGNLISLGYLAADTNTLKSINDANIDKNVNVKGNINGGITYVITYLAISAGSSTQYKNGQSFSAAGTVYGLKKDGNIAVQPAIPRATTVTIQNTFAGLITVTIDINGLDADGDLAKETQSWSLAALGTITASDMNRAFITINGYTITTTNRSVVSLGTSVNTIGLPNYPFKLLKNDDQNTIFKVTKGGVELDKFFVNTEYGTITNQVSIAAGDNITIWYRPEPS
jgi:hypothetical protein